MGRWPWPVGSHVYWIDEAGRHDAVVIVSTAQKVVARRLDGEHTVREMLDVSGEEFCASAETDWMPVPV